MKQLGPGVYASSDGNVRFYPRELAAALGVEYTLGNATELHRRAWMMTEEHYALLPPKGRTIHFTTCPEERPEPTVGQIVAGEWGSFPGPEFFPQNFAPQ